MNKVLLVDDVTENLEVTKDLLEDLIPDCHVFTAQSGKEGLKIARDEQPDTIITDIKMHEMNGYELCRRLKAYEATTNIPIMILTGSKVDAEWRVKCLDAGADVFLSKPVDSSELIAQINVMLRCKKAEDKLRAEKVDLEERVKERTKELRGSEEALMTVIENIPFAVFAHNLDGKFTIVNQTSSKYTGYTKDELLSMTVKDIDNESITRNDRKLIWEELKNSGYKEIVSNHCRKDGSIYPAEIYFTAITIKNEPLILGVIKDITERKQAEEKINILAHSLRSVNECVSITDTKDIIYFVNDAYTKTYGYTKEELIGKHISILHPKHVTLEIENIILNKTIESGWSGEIVNQKKDGTIFPVYLSTSVIKDDKDNIIGLVGVTTDITERKQAEKVLAENELQFRSLSDASMEGIGIVHDGKILVANKKACELFDYDQNEIVGKPLLAFIALESRELALKKFKDRFKEPLEIIAIRKSGSKFFAEVCGKSIEFKGQTGRVIAIRDITERKRAEEIQKTIYNISNALITVENMQDLYIKIKEFLGDVIDTNNFYIALYDEKTNIISFAYYADETFGRKDHLPASRKFGNGLTEYVIKTGKPLFATEDVVNQLLKKGLIESIGSPSEIWLGVPLNIENKVIGVIAVQSYHDPNLYTEKDIEILNFISEEIALAIDRKKAEEDLKVNRERLRIANSILRHDITNDIVVIKSALDIYRDENDVTMLDEIDKRIEKSINTIKKQREQEKFIDSHLTLVEYKIEKVVNKIINNYSEIEINVTGTGKVYADNAIDSLFENIISNAILHGKTKKIDIEINSEEENCVIRIADHGIGIPDEYKYDIFEEGFKYGPHGHTGIGLYIVQKTIEDYGGTVHVEDNNPHGVVFVIRLRKVIKK